MKFFERKKGGVQSRSRCPSRAPARPTGSGCRRARLPLLASRAASVPRGCVRREGAAAVSRARARQRAPRLGAWSPPRPRARARARPLEPSSARGPSSMERRARASERTSRAGPVSTSTTVRVEDRSRSCTLVSCYGRRCCCRLLLLISILRSRSRRFSPTTIPNTTEKNSKLGLNIIE